MRVTIGGNGRTLGTALSEGEGGDYLKNIENVIGSEFEDVLKGNDDNNSLTGRSGDDIIFGFNGDDIIVGGAGNDTLRGGAGDDIYLYLSPDEGGDTIDEVAAIIGPIIRDKPDKILVLAAGFGGGLSPGELPQDSFVFGSTATNSDQRFIFDTNTDQLFFDVDGSGPATQQLIANIPGALPDIEVI